MSHLLDMPGINNFTCSVSWSSGSKSTLSPNPASPHESAQSSPDFAVVISFLPLPVAFIFFREGECRQFAANSCCSLNKDTASNKMKSRSKRFVYYSRQAYMARDCPRMDHKVHLHVYKDVALLKTQSSS